MLKVHVCAAGARKIQRGHSGMSLSSDPHKSACTEVAVLRDGQAGVLGGGVVAGCRMHVQTDLHAVTDVLAQYSTAVVYRS